MIFRCRYAAGFHGRGRRSLRAGRRCDPAQFGAVARGRAAGHRDDFWRCAHAEETPNSDCSRIAWKGRAARSGFSSRSPSCRNKTDRRAQLEPGARLEAATHYVVKKQAFDLFTNPWLDGLRQAGAFRGQTCVVFGVATDYCVRACGLGLMAAGARVLLVEDAIRGVASVTTETTLAEMRAAGVEFTSTDDVLRVAGAGGPRLNRETGGRDNAENQTVRQSEREAHRARFDCLVVSTHWTVGFQKRRGHPTSDEPA